MAKHIAIFVILSVSLLALWVSDFHADDFHSEHFHVHQDQG